MKIFFSAVCVIATLFLVAANVYSEEREHEDHKFSTELSGFNEVHFSAGPPATLRGAVSTKAKGSFKAKLRKSEDVIDYELSYEGLEGTVTQAHIHFGQRHTVGGIVVWLCQTNGTRAPVPVDPFSITPLCPASGTVSGTITPAEVLAQTAQGIAAGEFEELVRALRAGAAYANVHSTLHTPGEIRGQVEGNERRD